MGVAIATAAVAIGSALFGASSSRKAAKAAKRAAKEEAGRIRWNADEVERSVEINDQAFAYNIEASEIASKFNVEQLNREAAFTEWATAFNDTIGRRQKRRQQGSQVVAIARSGEPCCLRFCLRPIVSLNAVAHSVNAASLFNLSLIHI